MKANLIAATVVIGLAATFSAGAQALCAQESPCREIQSHC